MKKIALPYFGDIDLTDDFFETKITTSQKQEVNVSIDFEGEDVKGFNYEAIQLFLSNIDIHIKDVKNILLTSDFAQQVTEYAKCHISDLKSDTNSEDPDLIQECISQIYPININIYPMTKERFFSIDYITDKANNYVLVVDLFENNSISYVTTES